MESELIEVGCVKLRSVESIFEALREDEFVNIGISMLRNYTSYLYRDEYIQYIHAAYKMLNISIKYRVHYVNKCRFAMYSSTLMIYYFPMMSMEEIFQAHLKYNLPISDQEYVVTALCLCSPETIAALKSRVNIDLLFTMTFSLYKTEMVRGMGNLVGERNAWEGLSRLMVAGNRVQDVMDFMFTAKKILKQ